jgi:hypothetical protein
MQNLRSGFALRLSAYRRLHPENKENMENEEYSGIPSGIPYGAIMLA